MFDKGKRNFNGCSVREVKFNNYYQVIGAGTNAWESKKPKDGKANLKIAAELTCPKTGDEKISGHVYDRQNDAFNELATLAGKMLCQNCEFAKMSPVDVEIRRTEMLRATAGRLAAETALLKEQQAYDEAVKLGMAELEGGPQLALPPAESED